jgi:non-heme chloroperoxidase
MPERAPQPAEFRVAPNARLHHLDAGRGDPVLLLHGSLTDARYWQRSGLLPALAAGHRVIAPSRRHNHPHPPSDPGGAYQAGDDAADAAELIGALGVGRVHLVGHSYGAYAALLLAVDRPELVRTLVLAEPPLMRWLPLLPGGAGVWEGFEAAVWRRLAAAFGENDAAGLDATARWYFGRGFADIDPAWQRDFQDAAREWRALTTSADAFPFVPFDRVEGLAVPTLLLSAGKNAGGFNDVIDTGLAALIPGARRVVFADASHELFLDAPAPVAATLLDFFAAHPG